jgi:hypothetical protein
MVQWIPRRRRYPRFARDPYASSPRTRSGRGAGPAGVRPGHADLLQDGDELRLSPRWPAVTMTARGFCPCSAARWNLVVSPPRTGPGRGPRFRAGRLLLRRAARSAASIETAKAPAHDVPGRRPTRQQDRASRRRRVSKAGTAGTESIRTSGDTDPTAQRQMTGTGWENARRPADLDGCSVAVAVCQRHTQRGDLRAHAGCRGLSLRCGGRRCPGWPAHRERPLGLTAPLPSGIRMRHRPCAGGVNGGADGRPAG